MDCGDRSIVLYTFQTDLVLDNLRKNRINYVKKVYIAKKYEETADVFLQAYAWYVERAQRIVPKPEEAESPIWTFCDPTYIEKQVGGQVLKMQVPMDEAVFFRMSDWNKILNFRCVGKNEEEEKAFSQKLVQYGISYEGDVYMTPFYPHMKKELLQSWNNLFQYDAAIKQTGDILYPDMQAGLWRLDAKWIQAPQIL